MTRWPGSAIPGNRWDLLAGMVPDRPAAVSVIVAHYRQPEQLARTLHALRRQDHPQQLLEVIVADDGSPEAPVVPDGVRLVRQADEGFRLAAARNLGAAAASGEILVFLDADTTPEPAFIRELVRLPSLAPDCITVGRRRHAELDGIPPAADIEHAAAGRELPEPAWLRNGYCASRDLLDADDRSYRFVIGAVLACSRRMFEHVGGFDESFTSYGGEDWEWAYRAWVRGAMLAHVPAAVAWHDGPDAAGRSTIDLASKNAQAIRLSGMIPVPGSRARGLPVRSVDVAVIGPGEGATEAQMFVSVDSVLAALPGARRVDLNDGGADDRLDRVRVRVEILRPLVASGDGLAEHVARVGPALGELLIVDAEGDELIRISSSRASARNARWQRDDLFPIDRAACPGVRALAEDPDVEAYLGGWAD